MMQVDRSECVKLMLKAMEDDVLVLWYFLAKGEVERRGL